jgi:hypothetical protein
VLERRGELGAAARDRARRFGADAYAERVEPLLRGRPTRAPVVAAAAEGRSA